MPRGAWSSIPGIRSDRSCHYIVCDRFFTPVCWNPTSLPTTSARTNSCIQWWIHVSCLFLNFGNFSRISSRQWRWGRSKNKCKFSSLVGASTLCPCTDEMKYYKTVVSVQAAKRIYSIQYICNVILKESASNTKTLKQSSTFIFYQQLPLVPPVAFFSTVCHLVRLTN